MKQLLTIKEQDVFPQKGNDRQNIEYKIRKAARAVVFDSQGLIALMKVSKHHYHKLPGGGFQAGEDVYKALERELKEEIGCKATVTGEVGEIIEYRDSFNNQLQYSYCFIAKVIGEKGEPTLENDEIEDGFEVLWVDIDKAIDLLSGDKTDDYQGKFILRRDLAFLQEARKILKIN